MVDGLYDGPTLAQGSDLAKTVDASVCVYTDEEVDASGIVADGEGSDLGDFHMADGPLVLRTFPPRAGANDNYQFVNAPSLRRSWGVQPWGSPARASATSMSISMPSPGASWQNE